jgi:RND family efflux transporter MFP subunit
MTAPSSSTFPLRRLLPIVLVVLVAVVAAGLWSRRHASAALADETRAAAIPIVSTARATAEPPLEEIVLPGTVQAQIEAPVYARTSGYLKHWYVDIGGHVKAGQLLADIASPEVDQALKQANADLKTAQANNTVAQQTAARIHALLPSQSVSQQQDDQAASDAAARAAAVASNQANVGRLRELVGFERVVAPFDGVVTARDTDVGALISGGAVSGVELFKVADTRRLRIYVQVPQSYAALVHPGEIVSLAFPEYAGKTFPATLVRTATAIEPKARTLLVEISADNRAGQLFAGGYTDVHFKLPVSEPAITVAANTLLFRSEGLRVAIVDAGGRVTLRPIKVGRDFGTTVEVVDGLRPGEQVIINPPAAVQTGDTVRVAASPAKTAVRS